MRYPTKEQSDGARAQKALLDFGLTARAVKFARVYAETPDCTISAAARAAGYSDRARGAHVRGCELLRDPRVVRAVLHYSALALARARGEAIRKLRALAEDRGETWLWRRWDHHAFERLRKTLDQLEPHTRRIERIYETGRYEGCAGAGLSAHGLDGHKAMRRLNPPASRRRRLRNTACRSA
jgi:hypothetical protein